MKISFTSQIGDFNCQMDIPCLFLLCSGVQKTQERQAVSTAVLLTMLESTTPSKQPSIDRTKHSQEPAKAC